MPDRPLLTLTLIARDEKRNISRCLERVWDHVDEVVIVDTGSKDGTLGEALRYAKRRKQTDKLKTARFTACNDADGHIADFSLARQHADELATGQWLVWCDLDDEVRGLGPLRKLAAEASEEVVAFFTRYSYAQDPSGNTISELWRERVVRNDGNQWRGRLHEHKTFTRGTVVKVDPSVSEWIHHRDHEQRTGERNTRILEDWDRDQPNDGRILSALALEYMGSERHKDASDTFARFLQCPGEQPDRRAQATRHMCVMLMMQNRVEEAREAALASLRELWTWADTHLTLAEVEQTAGRPQLGLVHAQQAYQLGKPDTLLIINPLQYTAHALALMGVCLAQMGRFEEAVTKADECLQIAPTYPLAAQHVPLWRGQLKKQHSIGTVLALCDVLIEVGELEKAQALLDCAPYYVAEEIALIRKRVEVQRAIRDRLETPAGLVVDEAADAFVTRHLELAA